MKKADNPHIKNTAEEIEIHLNEILSLIGEGQTYL